MADDITLLIPVVGEISILVGFGVIVVNHGAVVKSALDSELEAFRKGIKILFHRDVRKQCPLE